MKNTHQQTFQGSLIDFIGLPYEKYDCYELVKHFYKMVFGVELKKYDYEDPLNNDAISKLITVKTKDFIEVNKPLFGDIVLIRILNLPSHIGVYLGDGKILHTMTKTGSIIESAKKLESRILGYYRYDKD